MSILQNTFTYIVSVGHHNKVLKLNDTIFYIYKFIYHYYFRDSLIAQGVCMITALKSPSFELSTARIPNVISDFLLGDNNGLGLSDLASV